jgi:outer membrane protein assembly factor BamE (lipoprotein component of BamABCDE complex)
LWAKKGGEKMFKSKLIVGFSLVVLALLSGCMTAAQHQQSLPSTKEREMTVGIVQKEIRVGMSQADVAVVLGSPNIVTRDSEGKETWIYDKIATEASYSRDSGGIGGGAGAGGVAGTTLILGLFGGSYSREVGAASTTQKTLTIIIKFDKNNKVESFSYHASKF